LFVSDLAAATRLPPSSVRAALWTLLRRGLATNDRFDVIRRGEGAVVGARSEEPPPRLTSGLLSPLRKTASRRPSSALPEGRWALIPWGQSDVETQAVYQAELLLQRFGIVARELALLESDLLPWRVLYEVLSRMELAGTVRRGYFVEGLHGAQFALPEA